MPESRTAMLLDRRAVVERRDETQVLNGFEEVVVVIVRRLVV